MTCINRHLRWSLMLTCLQPILACAQETPAGHDMSSMDHAAIDHSHMNHAAPPTTNEALPPGVPPVTDADRAAAFPDLGSVGMKSHMDDDPVNYMVLLDRMEVRDAGAKSLVAW